MSLTQTKGPGGCFEENAAREEGTPAEGSSDLGVGGQGTRRSGRCVVMVPSEFGANGASGTYGG